MNESDSNSFIEQLDPGISLLLFSFRFSSLFHPFPFSWFGEPKILVSHLHASCTLTDALMFPLRPIYLMVTALLGLKVKLPSAYPVRQ